MRSEISETKTFYEAGGPSSIYGGMFDLVNTDPGFSETDLKFMALFYDAVIVPDAFLMCYTPLFRGVDRLLESSSEPNRDIISLFLRAGIVVPAIRQGDSLLKNWGDSIMPSTEMRVGSREGQRVLKFVDNNISRYTRIDLDPTKNRFGDLLNKFMIDVEKPLRCSMSMQSLRSHGLSYLFDTFETAIKDGQKSKVFRRLDIERVISGYLIKDREHASRKGFVPKLYEHVNELVRTNPRDVGLSACQLLLNETSTIYQAYHAHQFSTTGGLFPAHDRGLIEAGLYEYLTGSLPRKVLGRDDRARRRPSLKRTPVLLGSLDVGKFRPDQIVAIRQTPEFKEHVTLLSRWREPRPGETAYDSNPAFVEHLKTRYLPRLMREYPDTVWVSRAIKAGGVGIEVLDSCENFLLSFLEDNQFAVISVMARPVLSALKSAAPVAAHYSGEIARAVHSASNWRRRKKFLNQYWAKMN